MARSCKVGESSTAMVVVEKEEEMAEGGKTHSKDIITRYACQWMSSFVAIIHEIDSEVEIYGPFKKF